jgi:DNA ligase 1
MNFPRLFKKTSTGAIQFWDISGGIAGIGDHGLITTTYGQLGTDNPQTTSDIIDVGKNIGKANETSPAEQAELEAKSRWEKKQKSGYVTTRDGAEGDEVSELIEGGIVPMLAHTFEKQGHKIKYPCYVQPKLDGIRCIAIVKDGKCTLWSRTRKPVTSCPHIVKALEKIFPKDSVTIDGELYNHLYRENFEHIVHLVRQETPDPKHTDVQYHIYDLVNGNPFSERAVELNDLIKVSDPLFPVQTALLESEDFVGDIYTTYRKMGYEGAMLRNAKGLYANKRSSDLIKVKEMKDEEFDIVGIEEGRGKLSGHVGAFICKTQDGQEFKAKPAGATERLREYFLDMSLWQGRQLVVQFQDLTSYGIPRFPVGLRLKEQM